MLTLLVVLALMGGALLSQSTAWSADASSQTGKGTNICRNVFSKQDRASEVCANFQVLPKADPVARIPDIDRVKVVPINGGARPLDACHVAHLIRNTEALNRARFFELLFDGITIKGRLHLDEMDSVVRLVFQNVKFVDSGASQLASDAPLDPACGPAPARTGERSPPTMESPYLEPALRGASLVISRSRFREHVVFSHTEFAGHVVISGNQFEHSFNIVDSIIGGDFVLEDLKFDRGLRLGEGTEVYGQVVVHDVRVGGDFDLDSVSLLAPARWQAFPQAIDHGLEGTYRNESNKDGAHRLLSSACVCVERNGRPRLDKTRFEGSHRDDAEARCRALAVSNLPRCPRSNGSEPILLEISGLNVGGSFSVTGLNLDLEGSAQGGPEGIALYDVNVGGSGLLSCNRTRALWLNHSRLQRLQSENNIYGKFVASRNEIGSFKSVRDTFYNGVAVTQNGFARSLEVDSGVFPLASEEIVTACQHNDKGSKVRVKHLFGAEELSEKGFINLANNSVGRDLTFTPYQVDASRFRRIDLSSSRVNGMLGMNLPVTCSKGPCEENGPYSLRWRGQVQLSSVNVDGTLALRLARTDKEKRRATVVRPEVSQEAPFKLSCKKEDSVRIDVGNTVTNDFIWGLPITAKPERCFVWEGVGFRYANWHHENPIENNSAGEHPPNFGDLKQWGELYHREDGQPVPSDPLHYIADYLGTHGEQRESRQVRGDAKAADFPLHEPWKACLADASLSGCGRGVGNAAALIIFLPTYYGTMPEVALLILFTATLVCFLVYYRSSRSWKRHGRWEILQEARDELEKRNGLERELQQYVAIKKLEEALKKGPDDTQVGSIEKHDRLIDTVLNVHAKKPKETDVRPGEVTHLSAVPGFMQYDRNRQPQDFGLFRYAVDVSIPVVDLHAYSQYFPASKWPRFITTVQHIIGWWVLTSLLATLAVF